MAAAWALLWVEALRVKLLPPRVAVIKQLHPPLLAQHGGRLGTPMGGSAASYKSATHRSRHLTAAFTAASPAWPQPGHFCGWKSGELQICHPP